MQSENQYTPVRIVLKRSAESLAEMISKFEK